MLRNCSSALELSTAAAETGRRVVSGRALSCVVGGVTTAWVCTAPARRAATRDARAVRGALLLPANPDDFADPALAVLWRTAEHAAAHTEDAILY